MSTSLRNRLNDLASSFSASVLDAIRGASLEELLSESTGAAPRGGGSRASARAQAPAGRPVAPAVRKRGGRLARRSADDIGQAIDNIVALLAQHPGGLRAEEIRQNLGIEAKE